MSDELTADDFEATTFVQRERARELAFQVASGEITEEEAAARQQVHRNFKHDLAIREAAEEGTNDPVRIAALEAEIDQRYADLHAQDEILSTGAGKVVFKNLGFIAHPGMTWDDLDIDAQDMYRRTADSVAIYHIDAREKGIESDCDDLYGE